MKEFARLSGQRIVEMVLADIKPRDILTPGAFHNAAAAVLAVSGSINCIKHLQAIAVESGVRLDVFNLFNDLGEKIPVLSAVRPNGEDSIESFEAAGGARAIMKQLAPLLDLSVLTVTGRSVGENLSNAVVHNADVIRPITRPFSNKAPIVILHGSLAPESAIVKLGLRGPDRVTRFTGAAIVYEGAAEAIQGIKNGDVRAGHALVVRGMGLKGGPGTAGPASAVVFALDAAGLQSEVAFITDGQLSGLCNKGLTVAEVSPESAVGGPLSLVVNGDSITIDVDQRILDIAVSSDDLAARRARLGEPVLPKATGYLSIYQRTVQPMSTGAVLVCVPPQDDA
jgi:dihydroxy-acid dehydratase